KDGNPPSLIGPLQEGVDQRGFAGTLHPRDNIHRDLSRDGSSLHTAPPFSLPRAGSQAEEAHIIGGKGHEGHHGQRRDRAVFQKVLGLIVFIAIAEEVDGLDPQQHGGAGPEGRDGQQGGGGGAGNGGEGQQRRAEQGG